jgi:hypothetical protein
VTLGDARGGEGGRCGGTESRVGVDLDQACLRGRSGGACCSAYSL